MTLSSYIVEVPEQVRRTQAAYAAKIDRLKVSTR